MEDEPETPGITSDVDPTGETDVETPEADSEPEEEAEPKDTTDWKQRYSESTKEFQKLNAKLKEYEGLTAQERNKAEKLQEERDSLMKRLKDEQPETYDAITLKSALDSNSRELAELKEKVQLDDFISDEPLAKPYREALKAHARAFPKKSMQDIWNDSFKDIAEAKKEIAETKTARKKESQPDKGKGTSTAEPGKETIAGMPVEDFNKLSVEKRRELLIKANIQL